MGESNTEDAARIPESIRSAILEPFATAALSTLEETAQSPAIVDGFFRAPQPRELGDVFAFMQLKPEPSDFLMLCVRQETADKLARRALAESNVEPDPSLVRDSMGEILNVIAGQAKTILNETPYHFFLSTPLLLDPLSDAFPKGNDASCWGISFSCEAGELHLVLRLTR